MKSLIYRGEVNHARLAPVQHRFRYPVYFYAFDLDELPALARKNWLFGYNQLRPVALHDKDYLFIGEQPLRDKLEQVLQGQGIQERPARVMLVTAARYFNYVFNPISYFYCYRESGELLCVLGQVNNTFKEMHLYLLVEPIKPSANGQWIYKNDKQFHVSPFFTRDGYYQFHISQPEQQLDNQIHFYQDDELKLIARIQGRAEPLTSWTLLRTILRYPLSASLTMPRILWQAAKLYWHRRLPVQTKPVPDHAMTIRFVPPTLFDRLGRIMVLRHLSQLKQGAICLQFPEGGQVEFGSSPTQQQQLQVRDNSFFRKVMRAGEIGFGESFTAGDWTSRDLSGLLTMLAANDELVDDRSLVTSAFGRWANYLRHLLRTNTIRGSSRNIREHYDLSNAFFATFLDPSMTYSAALFVDGNESLEQAQLKKIHRIIEKAEIGCDDHVLEIGCGWGSFAIEAVRQTGCRVTGISLSQEQLKLARERVQAAGLEDRIELQLCDYRKIKGQYDKIVSIEMLEAVGHAGLKSFFAACNRALRPGGKAVLQVITIPDRKYRNYRHSCDWIGKHIFPGGHLPSIGALVEAIAASSKLNIDKLENFGSDYARTLALWRQALLTQKQQIINLGFDEQFLRKWEYYFAYCQAGFAARIIDVAQIVLQKPLLR
jgi:cyclopropane-fatty-acyl-phospholipid synthase